LKQELDRILLTAANAASAANAPAEPAGPFPSPNVSKSHFTIYKRLVSLNASHVACLAGAGICINTSITAVESLALQPEELRAHLANSNLPLLASPSLDDHIETIAILIAVARLHHTRPSIIEDIYRGDPNLDFGADMADLAKEYSFDISVDAVRLPLLSRSD